MYIICIYSLCWLAGIIIFFLSFFPLFLSFFLWLNWRSITSHLGSQDRKLCRTTYVCVWFCYLDRASATKMPNSGSGSLPTLIRITGYFYGWLVVGRRNRSSGLFTCHHHLFLFFFFPSTSCSRVLDVMTVFVNIAGGSQQDDVNMPNNTWPHAILL